jgi:sarcosine oxidase delta subunit
MDIEKKPNSKRIIMKIRGQLVDMLVNIALQNYQDFVHMEESNKGLYVEMLKHSTVCSNHLCYTSRNFERTLKILDLR